ncbi:MAG: porin family protein [Bacteroidales bacterium]|nr:porin family protein [Bacteroidales bacterium]
MKKLIIPILLIVSVLTTANAQFTKIGGGVAAGTGIFWNNETDIISYRTGLPAVFLTGIYEFTLPIHIAPSFTYYFPHITKAQVVTAETPKQVVSCMMFDINGHYVFNSLDRFEFYGLAGLNVTLIGIKWISEINGVTNKTKDRDNAFGLNLGAGTYIKLTDQFDLYGEAKYILSKYDQFLINVGVLINIDWLIKHEDTGL